jgi:hypothetical protein
MPVPTGASDRDMIAVFDAVVEEVSEGRKILMAIVKLARERSDGLRASSTGSAKEGRDGAAR